MTRGRKKGHILETTLGSKIFVVLINNPQGINGYSISQIVFGEQFGVQGKTFQILKEMSDDGLVLYPEKTHGKEKIFKPIFSGLAKLLNSVLAKEYKLDQEEQNQITKILKNTKWNISSDISKTNILEFFKLILAVPCLVRVTHPRRIEKRDIKNVKKQFKTVGSELVDVPLEFYLSLFKLPNKTLFKIANLIPFTDVPKIVQKYFNVGDVNPRSNAPDDISFLGSFYTGSYKDAFQRFNLEV